MFKLYRLLKSLLELPAAALGLPPHSCRYQPSCSKYCQQAFKKYSPLKASWLCFTRISRCNPANPPGIDPLP